MAKKELLSLNINKSSGPDKINSRILIELAEYIAGPIAFLFNMTMNHGVLPRDWKRAFVTPIYKKGSRSHAENYRPISLTCILGKIMEKFVREKVMTHLLENKLLTNKQYGFISGRSTTIQLLNYLDSCVKNIVDGNAVDVIYLDFTKAFDTVPHRHLIGKLELYGISGNLLGWISDFLRERSHIVSVNGAKSASAYVISGIPH